MRGVEATHPTGGTERLESDLVRYPNQASNSDRSQGIGRPPALIGRVLDGGASQVTQLSYTTAGLLASATDPLGRQTTYTHASNAIDLLEVRQVASGGTELLASYGNYADHRPGTITDAAGQTTTITYNSAKQPLTVTNALSQTTTYAYESGTGYLLSVTGPVTGRRRALPTTATAAWSR